MARKNKFPRRSFVMTAAQGTQNPASARRFGLNSSAGQPHEGLLACIDEYCDAQGAELVIQAMQGSYVAEIELAEHFREEERQGQVFMEGPRMDRLNAQRRAERDKRAGVENWNQDHPDSPRTSRELHFRGDVPNELYRKLSEKHLNRKMVVLDPQVPPQNEDPTSGLRDLTQDFAGKSVVLPHAKQSLLSVPKDLAGKTPRVIYTTGACTLPNYNVTNARGKRANRHHQFGFCVVDVISDTIYLPRLVPARADGTFVDLGIMHSPIYEPHRVDAAALILGDIHAPLQDDQAMQASYEQIEVFKPKEIYIHDLIDFRSIAHHQLKDSVRQMWLAEKFDAVMDCKADSLEDELKVGYDFLQDLSKRAGGAVINVLPSNHDEFVHKWLARGAHLQDRKNARMGSRIMAAYYEGDSVLQRGLEIIGPIPENVNFLGLTDDRRPWGYQCSAHGHLGVNGSRGSLKQFRGSYGKVIIGHVHQLQVIGKAISVGTNSIMPLDYQRGQPSTSMHGNAVIYEGGFAQAIPIINGRWRK